MTTNIKPRAIGPTRPAHRGYRLPAGRRSKFAVLAFWIVLASVAAPLAIKLTEVQDNDQLTALPARAEAQAAAERAAAAFPGHQALVAVAVYVRDTGLINEDRLKAETDRATFARYAEGGRVEPAVPSGDGKALLVSFALAKGDASVDAVGKIKDRLAADVPGGLHTALTGSAAATGDLFDAFAGMDTALLLVTALAVAMLLVIIYRSPVLWLLPLIVVGVASQITNATVYLLARYAGLTVDLQSQSITTILVFGVGVDYALLLLARYRESLHQHTDRHAAMAHALHRTLPAVAASAATVAVGLLCLVAADLPATRGLGPIGAIGVAVAFTAMMTLLPAVVLVFGRWVFWPLVPRVGGAAQEHRLWWRIAGGIGRHPRILWIGTAAVLVALTLGIGNLSVGLPGDESFTTEVGSVTGQHLLESHYPGGTVAPAEILATTASADRGAAAARGVPGVAEVGPAEPSPDRRWVRFRAILVDPPDSSAALSTVDRLRVALRSVPGGQALVGGETATILDTRRTAKRDNAVVLPLVLAVVLAILVLLLRAVVAALVLLAGVILSYAATLGVAGLILHVMGHPRLWDGVPLQTFLFLVALGVDYSIFLMTRAREETAKLGHRTGVLRALAVTGGVITSAGVVLAATFGALNILPLAPSVQIAVIVSVGVLLDTLLVRTLLVPALILHIGPRAWWPGRVGQVTPRHR
jgi:RND superfamily putative drug exporter